MNLWKRLDNRERVALVTSTIIVLTTVVYWIVQIDGVRAMLSLAYG